MPIWTVAEDSIDEALLCPIPSQGLTTGGGLNESLFGLVTADVYVVAGNVVAGAGDSLGNKEYDRLDGDVAEGGG